MIDFESPLFGGKGCALGAGCQLCRPLSCS
jgi:hypothetical protein